MNPSPVTPHGSRNQSWHVLPLEKVLALVTSTAKGLSSQEAAARLLRDGPNALREAKPISPIQIFLRQFKSLMTWILVAAAVVSGFLGERTDAFAIVAIIALNAVIGFYQEFKAGRSIAALKELTAPHATVLRGGQVEVIPAVDIVLGDILVLEAGNLVAADARLLEAAALKCIESPLTGESEAVSKRVTTLEQGDVALGDRENMVFLGTSIAAGTGQAVVVATAMETELGLIAGLIEEAGSEGRTPLEIKLESFGRVLVWAALAIVAVHFLLGLLRGISPLQLFMTSVSLAVAAVPEGLPTVVTVALALGVLRMSRRRALVRKLPAVETLGATTVICTDKTGTLTVGAMTVRALYVAGSCYEVTGEGYGPGGEVRREGRTADQEHLAPLRALANLILGCNNAHLQQEKGVWKVIGDPTEGALLAAGAKAGGDRERLEQEMPKQAEFPFDSDRKRSSVLRRMPEGGLRLFSNGAPGVLLDLCSSLYTLGGVRPMTAEDRQEILSQTAVMAGQALRVLASSYRDLGQAAPGDLNPEALEREMVFVGLTGMFDPPRPEAMDAVARCRAAGIQVVMITGDHPGTATAIAQSLGIVALDEGDRPVAQVVTGVELDRMSDQELRQRVSRISVFARVTAEHKLRIIRAWKANGAVVAMTGDGVNDAPAIHGADIGIAMGRSGTEVTKQASDIIITDDNFATIVAAVEEGRGIYDNIRKTLQYLLAGNTGELVLMTLCVVAGLPAPLLPIHLLWINLVTDGLPALCLAGDPIDPDVMERGPRRSSERITDRRFLKAMLITGLLTAGVAFLVYLYVLRTGTPEKAQTCTFAVLVFAELLRSFGARSETKPIWKIPFFTNINLAIVVAVSFALQIGSQHNAALGRFLKTSHMPLLDCGWLLLLGCIPLIALELLKLVPDRAPREEPPQPTVQGS